MATITNLKGTTWLIQGNWQDLSPVIYDVGGYQYCRPDHITSNIVSFDQFRVGYYNGSVSKNGICFYDSSSEKYSSYFWDSNFGYLYVTFTSGKDLTNSGLISWLNRYGTGSVTAGDKSCANTVWTISKAGESPFGKYSMNGRVTKKDGTAIDFTEFAVGYGRLEAIGSSGFDSTEGSVFSFWNGNTKEWLNIYSADDLPLTIHFYEGLSANQINLNSWLETNGTQLTDLTGTTWYVPSGWGATKNYGKFSIDFAIETSQTSQDNGIGLAIGYNAWVDSTNDGTANSISWTNNGGAGGAITPTDSFTLSIKGGEDVANSSLIAWLSKYGELQETYTLSGTWVFNETPVLPSNLVRESNLKFTVPTLVGESTTVFNILDIDSTGIAVGTGNTLDAGLYSSNSWNSGYDRKIYFDGIQTVSEEFYTWFTANAKPMITDLTGYTVTVPEFWFAAEGEGKYTLNCRVIAGSIDMQAHPLEFNIGYNKAGNSSFDVIQIYIKCDDSSAGIVNSNPLTLYIYEGFDASNPALIQWLYDNNATFEKTGGEEKPETPTERGEIWYKGVLLATLTEGQTVILHTEGFKATEGIVIKKGVNNETFNSI